jgi:hypothetical protein
MAVSLARDFREAIGVMKRKETEGRKKRRNHTHLAPSVLRKVEIKNAPMVGVEDAANQRILLGHRDSNPE